MIRYLISPLICGILFTVFSSAPGEAWLSPTLSHPLGTDEFGRDILGTCIAATAFSLLKGGLICSITLILSGSVAFLIGMYSNRFVEFMLRISALTLESIPIVFWVLIIFIVLKEPRELIVVTAFCIAALPIIANVLVGEINRLKNELYIEAAFMLGNSKLRVFIKYILPNAKAVVIPLIIQVLGAAIAIDGAIGVLGLGNRQDLDLGTFLLRGKENIIFCPQLLFVSLFMYAMLFWYIFSRKDKRLKLL